LSRHEEVLWDDLKVIVPWRAVCYCSGGLCVQICRLFIEIRGRDRPRSCPAGLALFEVVVEKVVYNSLLLETAQLLAMGLPSSSSSSSSSSASSTTASMSRKSKS
jgi:hypothetical protein